jgi:protocatechuate 3,4-dioxygenase beta subunit
MTTAKRAPINRRRFLRLALALPAPVVLAACRVPGPGATPTAGLPTATSTAEPASAAATQSPQPAPESWPLAPTPACGDDDAVTPAQTAGPFFSPSSPERVSLIEAGMPGTRLVLSGYVLTTGCQPVPGALLDFWQADDAGAYDNTGYRLRGHQFTDASGHYQLETIVPGLYPGRTRHIHVHVQAADQRVLTTQLYFPGEPANARDGLYRPELAVTEVPSESGRAASFDFVLAMG